METSEATDGVPAGYRDVVAWGDEEEIATLLRSSMTAGQLVSATAPRPHEGGVAIRIRMRHQGAGPRPVAGARVAVAAPASKQSWRGRVIARAGGGRVAAAALSVAGLLLVLGVVGWLLIRAVTATGEWVAARPGPAVAGLLVAVAGAYLLVRRKVGRRGRGDAHHCPGCPHH